MAMVHNFNSLPKEDQMEALKQLKLMDSPVPNALAKEIEEDLYRISASESMSVATEKEEVAPALINRASVKTAISNKTKAKTITADFNFEGEADNLEDTQLETVLDSSVDGKAEMKEFLDMDSEANVSASMTADSDENETLESGSEAEEEVTDPTITIKSGLNISEADKPMNLNGNEYWLTEAEVIEMEYTLTAANRKMTALQSRKMRTPARAAMVETQMAMSEEMKKKMIQGKEMRKKTRRVNGAWWWEPPYFMGVICLCMLLMLTPVSAVTTDHMLMNVAYFLNDEFTTAVLEIMDYVNFDTFGKMNSTVYRLFFHEVADSVSLSDAAVSMVILMTVLVKNKERIIRAVSASAELMANKTVVDALNFIKSNTSSYVSPDPTKFPLVKITDSFAPVSLLYFVAYNRTLTLTKLFEQMWFGNMILSPFLQDLHEMFARFFWTQIVKKTKNNTKARDKTRNAGTFYTDIYENTQNDTYQYLMMNSTVMTDYPKTLKGVMRYFGLIRNASPMIHSAMAKDAMILFPPRADWKFFHPRFVKDESVTTKDVYMVSGDYTADGMRFDANLTVGPLNSWMATFTESQLKAAPPETIIKIDTTELKLMH